MPSLIIVVAIPVVTVLAAFQWWEVRSGRGAVAEYVTAQGLTLLYCRYRWLHTANRVAFDVRVRDRTGHITTGVARVGGIIRDNVWIDWQ